MTVRPVLIFSLGAALLPVAAAQAEPQLGGFEIRRLLMRQVTQQLQARLEQRLRCINQAKTLSDLEACQRSVSTAGHHGSGMGTTGMGGWSCPIW